MLEVWQEPHVRIWKRRSRACSEVVHRVGRVLASDDIQPRLHFILVFELSVGPGAGCREELVQVELVKLTTTSNSEQLIWHLVR